MKTYQIVSPPETPGIYILHHKPTGDRYVGQSRNLRRRWAEWKSVFLSALGVKSLQFVSILSTTEPEDWEFIVMREVLPEEVNQLDRLERAAIAYLSQVKTIRLLNRQMPKEVSTVRQGSADAAGSIAKTELTDESGNILTYRAAADILGVTRQTIKSKLAKWRAQGITRAKVYREKKEILPIDNP